MKESLFESIYIGSRLDETKVNAYRHHSKEEAEAVVAAIKDGTWTVRCRKLKHNQGSVPVKNRVPEITAQALDDIVDDWFETNQDAECLQTDDWDDIHYFH